MENTTVNMINTTEHTGKNNTMVLAMCGVETMDRCYTQYGFKYTVVILNIISVFVNISHIRILRRMATSNSTTYMFVLQLISAADLQSTLHMLTCFCSIHELFVGQHIYYAAALAAIMSHSSLVKYASLATASIERYLSLCHPLHGTLRCDRFCSRLTQIKITAACFWCSTIFVPFITKFFDDLCMGPMFGPINAEKTKGVSLMLLDAVYIFAITMLMLFSHINTQRQIVSMRSFQDASENRNVKLATKYILIINILYYTCLLPGIVVMALKRYGINASNFTWVANISYSSYGILNVLIYGLRSKAYRIQVKNTLFTRKTVIRPIMTRSVADQRKIATVSVSKNENSADASTSHYPPVNGTGCSKSWVGEHSTV